MKKIKSTWNKLTKGEKILSIILVVLITCITVSCCSNPDKVEEGYEKGLSDSKQEQQKEEPAVEDKSEPEEESESNDVDNNNEDEYIQSEETNNDESEYDVESVDNLALTILRENFNYSSYDVDVNTTNKTVNVKVLSYDIDTSQLSKSQREYALYNSDLPSSFDGLANTMQEFYGKAGYDVNVKIKLYDVNGTLIYTARS